MLRVKTYLAPSSKHGIGLFAGDNISQGKVVWEYFPDIYISYNQKEWEELETSVDPHSFARIKNYVYKENGFYILCTDGAQFMNHDETHFNVKNSDDLFSMLAVAHIPKGSELLCNYFEYSDDDDHHVQIIRLI